MKFALTASRCSGGHIMKKFLAMSALIMVLAIPALTAHAVPSLGVATNVAYVGSTGQTGLEPYQDYFVNTFIPGTDETHGFVVGPSGSNLTVFTNWTGYNIYLLWSSAIQDANSPSITGYTTQHYGAVGQFDGYTPANYFGVNLGTVDSDWAALPSNIFTPDGNRGAASGGGTDTANFYALSLQLNYTGSILPGNYFFAIADTDGSGPTGNGRKSPNYDPFSPKTTSATGGKVPEPGTFLLLGSGLIGLAGWGRKKFRS